MSATNCMLPPMARKQEQPGFEKRVTLSARIKPSLIESLRELANADERPLAWVIEKAFREYIERHQQAQPRKR